MRPFGGRKGPAGGREEGKERQIAPDKISICFIYDTYGNVTKPVIFVIAKN